MKIKSIIQAILIISFSVIFSIFIDKTIYRPLSLTFGYPIDITNHIVITSISLWMLSVSLFYWINPNKILYHFLFCNLPYISVIAYFTLSKLIFLDFLHVPALIISLIIIIKDRQKLNLKYIIYLTLFTIFWLLFVNLNHLNYYDIIIFPQGVLFVLINFAINLFVRLSLSSNKHY
jgi:hypothetical protein